MEQDTVLHPIVSAMNLSHNVMTVPATLFGDFLTADGTNTMLSEPQLSQLFLST
jgi:hypothetical protein